MLTNGESPFSLLFCSADVKVFCVQEGDPCSGDSPVAVAACMHTRTHHTWRKDRQRCTLDYCAEMLEPSTTPAYDVSPAPFQT